MSTQSILSITFAFLGLIFGALFAVFVQNRQEKYVHYAESLASGFMLAVVFFDLLPNSMQKANFSVVFFGIVTGVVIILLISKISLERVYTKFPKCAIMDRKKSELLPQNDTLEHKTDSKRLISNLTTAFAVALHNIPEGIALGALDGQEILISTAILIAVHNIPEGMAMSLPLAKVGVKWYKILFFAFITGACTVVGWGIGVLVGGISDILIAYLLAISSGAMLQIVFGELMGKSQNGEKGNLTILGVLAGLVIIAFV